MPKAKKAVKEITNDQVREKILEYLFETRKKASSLSSVCAKISEIKSELKKHGINQNQVVTNLDFLIQHGWIEIITIKKTFKSPRGFDVPSETQIYKLSELGIDRFEGSSMFSRMSRFSGINITNINGITVLGDNNIIRAEFLDVFRKLEQLESSMKTESALDEEQKLSIQADIQTIKDQLSKKVPEKSIVEKAMNNISFIASIPGLVDLYKIAEIAIHHIIH